MSRYSLPPRTTNFDSSPDQVIDVCSIDDIDRHFRRVMGIEDLSQFLSSEPNLPAPRTSNSTLAGDSSSTAAIAIALTSPTRNADTLTAGAGGEQRMSKANLLPRVTPPPRAPSTNHIRPIDPIGDLLDAAVEDAGLHPKKIKSPIAVSTGGDKLKDYIFEDDLEDIRNALAPPRITKKRGFSSQYREPIHPTSDTDDDDSSISSEYSITAMSGARSDAIPLGIMGPKTEQDAGCETCESPTTDGPVAKKARFSMSQAGDVDAVPILRI